MPGEPEVVVLRDGTRAVLRTADVVDGDALRELLGDAALDGRWWVVEAVEWDGLIGAGGYLEPHDGTAETRFVVAAEQLGRGIGTLLLEHAIEAAAEDGIETLVSEVAPHDRALEVLRRSGAHLVEEATDGRVRVEISTHWDQGDPARRDEREQARTAYSLLPFFRPQVVAVIGASRSRRSVGGQIFHRLVEADFAGTVYPVNPSAHSVRSVRAYPSLAAVPDEVDLAIVAVPAPAVPEVVEQCADEGVRAVVVISAGFGEVGEEGRRRQEALLQTVRQHGMRMIGPNCLGVLNTDPAVRLNATFGRALSAPGRVGMSSQSGAMGLVIVDYASELGLGLSTFASVGNKADVSGNDLLEYWERDPATRVIVLYLESFGNPRRFSRIARRVSRSKPILAVKSGRSQAGSRAAQSHTAALASSDAAVDALFEQTGVIRLDTLEELFDVAAALSQQPLPDGNRVAVITNAGGPAILCADACEAGGLTLPGLAPETLDVLRAVLPSTAGLGNPVDMIAAATPEQYEVVTQQVLQDPNIDALIALNVSVGAGRSELFADAVRRGVETARTASGQRKPVLTCLMSPGRPSRAIRDEGDEAEEEPEQIPAYRFPESPGRSLARMWQYRSWLERPRGRVVRPEGVDAEAARRIVRGAAAEERRWLTAGENAELLQTAGIATPWFREVASTDEAVAAAEEIGRPVAVKVIARDIVHKTDVGGVALNLDGGEAARAACERMQERLGDAVEGFFVQEMVREGTEVIVGLASDPTFGPLIAFGLGGTAVEVLEDVAFRVTPLTDTDAQDLIRSIRGYPLLDGYRGAPVADRTALVDLVIRLSWLAGVVPEIAEMDLNPVRVFPQGEGLGVVDVRTAVG